MTALHVAYLGNFEPEHSTENHIRQALLTGGHHVHVAQENDLAAWQTVADRAAEFDFILWTRTGWAPPVPGNLKRRVRHRAAAAGVPVVGYHLDRWWGLNREFEVAKDEFFRVDLLVTADGGHDEQWAAAGVNHVWMPPAVLASECGLGAWREEYAAEVGFVGSWQEYHPEWPYRGRLVRWLQSTYGDRFKVWSGGVRGQDLRDLYASVDVVVGDSCLANGATHYWSDRVPETTGRGGFLIHPEVPGLADQHPDVIRYGLGDFDELADMIDHFIERPDIRQHVVDRTRPHTLEHHTYEHRVEQLVDLMRDRGMLAWPDVEGHTRSTPFRDRIVVVPDQPRSVVPVRWVTFDRESIPAGYWDQEIVNRLLDADTPGKPDWAQMTAEGYMLIEGAAADRDGPGGVVVIPGRFHATAERVAQVQELVRRMEWVVLIVTSDEESLFPWRAIEHPRMRMWIQTPDPDKHDDPDLRLLVFGPSSDFADLLPISPPVKDNDWVFSGQVTHARRQQAAEVLRGMTDGLLVERERFAEGDRKEYAELMASAKVVPCPSGPETPDTFRAWEALDAGAVPVLDQVSPKMPHGRYWPCVAPGAPLPSVADWSTFPEVAAALAATWPAPQNRVVAWWRQYQAAQSARLVDDVRDLAGLPIPQHLADLVTVVVTASPIPTHPSSAVLNDTLVSLDNAGLTEGQLFLMWDGVRPDMEHRRDAYEQHIAQTLWMTRRTGAVPFISDEHVHQAGLLRLALEHVRTPLVLFMEHDTPLVGDIDWWGASRAILGGAANVIRFHHEVQVLDVHQHLMLDRTPVKIEGVPLLRTAQWSQRPHLASTDFYRKVLAAYFSADSRTFIEDVLHGALDYAYRTEGEDGWNRWRTWMYAPHGNMQRSTHSDGRGDDPKADMVFAYDGPPPPGAPYPTRGRTDGSHL